MNEFEMKDSGERQEFDTGARRDKQDGKGRFDLISTLFTSRLAVVMERGATKYGDRNWEKGMPLSRYYNSAVRHMLQAYEGRTDEDHLGQAAFNIMAFMHTQEMIRKGDLPAELDDLPRVVPDRAIEQAKAEQEWLQEAKGEFDRIHTPKPELEKGGPLAPGQVPGSPKKFVNPNGLELEPTRTSIGEDDPEDGSEPTLEMLRRLPDTEPIPFVPEGMVRGFDGVLRPKADVDDSVKTPGVQTPICESDGRPAKAGGFLATPRPAVFTPKPGVPGGGEFDPLETGEL